MARADGTIILNKKVQGHLIRHIQDILTVHKKETELRNKMVDIDIAYHRYQKTQNADDGNVTCGNLLTDDNIVAPIVVSEVDSMVGYLAEVFLSGAPLFPIVSTPAKRKMAEQLETLLDDHATLGAYPRQLLMFLHDAVKYNVGAIEASWEAIDQFSVEGDYTQETGRKVERKAKHFTKLRRLDMYNTIWDKTVAPGDVALEGDYAGDIRIFSRLKLKRHIKKLTDAKKAYNVTDAFNNKQLDLVTGSVSNYYEHPTVNNYVGGKIPRNEVDWYKYFGDKAPVTGPGNFELITLYVRIIPSDFEMIVPQPNTPQIWKLQSINGAVLIAAERVISAQDVLPIFFGQPVEDGLGYQTKSVAEGSIPFQQAATTLFGIRFAAARRAVSDRALYDPAMINPSDINARVPAPKIPVRGSAMKDKGLGSAYMQIPFDMRGTESAIQDVSTITAFSKELNGINGPRRGQFQKGNKSVSEWEDTMGGSDNRLRLRALTLEHQVFVPLKETLKLNIFQYGEDAVVVSQKNGEEYTVKIDELRKQVLSFRVADGYTPKSKMASTEMLTTGLNIIGQSQVLQQQYGASLPAMFAHIMQLGGVRGLEEYTPQAEQQAAQGNLAGNTLQTMESGAPALQAPASVVPSV